MGYRYYLTFCRRLIWIDIFHRKELVKVVLISFAELLKIGPSLCYVGSSVKHDDALVENMIWGVLLNDPHNAADELYEW